jgi:arginine/ornithine transport system substrate-binding protein
MRKLTALILMVTALAFASNGVFAKEWKKIRIGVEGAYPPFSQVTPDGKLVGFDIDFANALCEEMGAECTMVQQDWEGIIPGLLARKYDAIIASMAITEQRKKHVAFTKPYGEDSPAKFARKKGSGIEINKASLKGKSVGVQRATIHAEFVKAEFGDVVDLKLYATQEEAYLDAVAGGVDLLLADAVAMNEGFLKTDQGKNWEFVGPDYTGPGGAGIAIRKDDEDLVAAFNKALAAILGNGTYKKINDKYFDFNVYGK